MRVSEHFALGITQPALEFVDVDIRDDTPCFVDPRALRWLESDWGNQCVAALQSYFDEVVQAIRLGKDQYAQRLLAFLSEPNETRLGLTRGRAAGRGMGRGLAERVWEQLSQSAAVTSGLLEDLEELALFVDGIDRDITSDITTNIIRAELISFTQEACHYYGIPMVADLSVGPTWDPIARRWRATLTPLPVVPTGPLVLVPKTIVRMPSALTFSARGYFDGYIVPFLQSRELESASSSLVEVLKNGRVRVTKKSVKEKYGIGKQVSLRQTLRQPDLLDQYRREQGRARTPPGHEEVAQMTGTDLPDWDALLAEVTDCPTGDADADRYHRAVQHLLSALFYPALSMPQREARQHQGRKRVDIRYTNTATVGFFHWVNEILRAPAPYVFVECKNYGREVANPEVDQLSGRFSDVRGKFGLLCHRGYGDKQRIIARCRDTVQDRRGFILALDDADLGMLVEERKRSPQSLAFRHLQARMDELTN